MPTLILPAAGLAERMGSIPKFLLPTGNERENLLSRWIASSSGYVDKVVIATNFLFFDYLNEMYANSTIEVKLVKSRSMAETVKMQVCTENTIVAMPDTYISNPDEFFRVSDDFFNRRNSSLGVSLWNIKDHQRGKVGQVQTREDRILQVIDKDRACLFPKFWGALSFTPAFHNHISHEDPHLGVSINRAIANEMEVRALVMNGTYNDCGTILEYKELLLKS